MNVFRTLMVPVAQGPLAVKITNALGNGHPGMFVVEVKDGATVGYISTGIVDDASPLLADAATLHAACEPIRRSRLPTANRSCVRWT